MSLEYETVSLGEHLYIKGRIGWKGLKKDEYLDNGNYRIINATALEEDGINWDDCGYITKERFDESPEIILKEKDILISKDGTIGKLGYVKELHMPSTVASGVFVVRNLNNEYIDTDFLYYYFKSPFFKWFIKSVTEGSVIPHLYQRDFTDMEFNLFDLDVQKKCSTILNAIEEKININKRINKNLFSIGRLIFKELILNEYSNNSHSNWVLVPFNEISTVQNGFAFKSNDYCDVGCNMIRTRDITSEGFVSNEDLINLPQSFYESKKYKNYKFERLDTITVMVGASIGKMGLITDINIPSLQNQNMWRFRSKLKNISPAFVYYYVEKINKEIINMATGSARSFYRKNLFLDYECIMPSNDYLNGINPLFNSLFDKISENVAEINKLTKLRDTLLPKLMSGEIDVSKINCDI